MASVSQTFASSSMETMTGIALKQFVTTFNEVCKEKELQLVTEDGQMVKMTLLYRMMYEGIMGSSPSEPYKAPKIQGKKGKSVAGVRDDVAREEVKEKPVRGPSNGIKINYKDLKKEEKKHGGMTIPFLPDLIDYVCDNSCCQSLKVNGNLFIPCGTNVKGWDPEEEVEEGETKYDFPICKTCRKQGNVEKYGSLTDRMACYEAGDVYEAPEQEHGEEDGSVDEDGKKKRQTGPKREVTFATFLAKKGELGKDAKQRPGRLAEKVGEIEKFLLEEFQFTYSFPESALKIDNSKVRAKKTTEGGEKKKRGRPAKKERSASVVSSSSEENDAPEDMSSQSSVEEEEVAAKPMENASEPEAEAEEEAEEEVAPKPVKKAVKKAVVPKKKAQEPEPEAEEEEEEAAPKPVKKAVKKTVAPKKKVQEPEPEAEEEPEPEAEEEPEPEAEEEPEPEAEEEEEDEEEVRPFTYKGKQYFMDGDYTVYNQESHYVGDYDPSTGKVEFINA